MDDADAFSFFYEREGEAVLFFLARRTMDPTRPEEDAMICRRRTKPRGAGSGDST
jgi:hypothetical protein